MRKIIIIIPLFILLFSCKKNEQFIKEEQKKEELTTDELVIKYSVSELKKIYESKINSTNKQIENTNQSFNHIPFDSIRKALFVIYGHDDRRDVFQVKNGKMNTNSKGVLALVTNDKIKKLNQNTYELITSSYAEKYNLCSNEPFLEQPVLSICTAFAVSKNIIITAGHCIETEMDLKNVKFIFDYDIIDTKNNVQKIIPNHLVLTGKRIISTKLDETKKLDYAIIETNEQIPDFRILTLEKKSSLNINTKVYVIGHPAGLPKKIADSSFVRDNSKENYFVANLDTYGGNSGSPVFNQVTHKIEGILVRGEIDFNLIDNCRVSKPCPDLECMGEEVSRNKQFLKIIKNYIK